MSLCVGGPRRYHQPVWVRQMTRAPSLTRAPMLKTLKVMHSLTSSKYLVECIITFLLSGLDYFGFGANIFIIFEGFLNARCQCAKIRNSISAHLLIEVSSTQHCLTWLLIHVKKCLLIFHVAIPDGHRLVVYCGTQTNDLNRWILLCKIYIWNHCYKPIKYYNTDMSEAIMAGKMVRW